MRLPKGYGQIIKLSGKRRRPYAVRMEIEEQQSDGTWIRKTKYLEYFGKRSEALDWLARYNAGVEVDVRPQIDTIPTFTDVYKGFMEWYQAKNPDASKSALQAYSTAYNKSTDLYPRKFNSLRTSDLQAIISSHSHQSKNTVNNFIKLFHGMYKYAGMNDLIDKDYSRFVFVECTDPEEEKHKIFTDEEIASCWKAQAEDALILLYTGMRITELLKIETENIHFDERYMIGGLKTKAGKNRVIPIHEAIAPIIEKRLDQEYLIDMGGISRNRDAYVNSYWNPVMKELDLNHIPHDTRHTASSLMERYDVPLLHRKLILGHAVKDITEGVYTHVKPDELVRDINLLPVFS